MKILERQEFFNTDPEVVAVRAEARKALGVLTGEWKLEILWSLNQLVSREHRKRTC